MDRQDVTHSFHSSSSLTSTVPKIANVDFLVQELQQLVKQQDTHEESTTEKKTLSERLGVDVSATDLVYIYWAAALIMRREVSHITNQSLKNICDENPHSAVSTSILDGESLGVGRFLTYWSFQNVSSWIWGIFNIQIQGDRGNKLMLFVSK